MSGGACLDTPIASRESKVASFARLGKLHHYDDYFNLLVVLSALCLPATLFDPRVIAPLLLFSIGQVLVLMATAALHDLVGFREGRDLANNSPDADWRERLHKPLVNRVLTEADVQWFAAITLGAGGLCWLTAILVAPKSPIWMIVLIAGLLVTVPQFSFGLKISYRGLQELFLIFFGAAFVVAPFAVIAGTAPEFVVVQGILFGFGSLMFTQYSNAKYVAGDRAVNRRTVLAMISGSGHAQFICTLSLTEYLVSVVASLDGIAPWWFALIMLRCPCYARLNTASASITVTCWVPAASAPSLTACRWPCW